MQFKDSGLLVQKLQCQQIMQYNASDLDGMETPTQQTKQWFRPVWNSDFNPVDKAMPQALIEQRPQHQKRIQCNDSGLDGIELRLQFQQIRNATIQA
jgi:hypothetical protein